MLYDSLYIVLFQDIMYYNVTSVFLGVGVILVWVGLLRFFQYFNKYNVSSYGKLEILTDLTRFIRPLTAKNSPNVQSESNLFPT